MKGVIAAVAAGSVALAVVGGGCQQPRFRTTENQLREYEMRMQSATTQGVPNAPELTSITRPLVSFDQAVASTQPTIEEALIRFLPDPSQSEENFRARLKSNVANETIERDLAAIFFGEPDDLSPQPGALNYIRQIQRPRSYRLGLAEAVRRTLANNYLIHFEGYSPAISTAQIVQAEAAFDTAFFANLNRSVRDRPTVGPFFFDQSNATVFQTGVRKLLATGATATISYDMTRTWAMLQSQQVPLTFNPGWTQAATAELRQPFLRNFGIDFNRSQINIRKNDLRISQERFRRTVIDRLNETERAYWNLVAARRNVVITAELLAQAERTLAQVRARIDYDAYQTLEANSAATVAARQSEFIEVANTVRNAEDALLNLLNDPELPLSADLEIVPTDAPTAMAVVRDRFHEIETAIQHRPEIQEARAAVERARLQVGIAKNQALPQLNGIFRIASNGFNDSWDDSWAQVMGGNYQDTFVGMEFAWNFGERAERAGIRAATMAHSQAIFGLKRAIDDVITDCRTTLREVITRFEQIRPNIEAVKSSAENLRSIQEREERKSPEQLNTVLSAQTQLAQNRRALLQALVTYNQSIVNLERAKGTLLEYNNVVLSEVPRSLE